MACQDYERRLPSRIRWRESSGVSSIKSVLPSANVSCKDIKALMADLKPVYQTVTEEEAFDRLAVFKENWGKQYPSFVKSWEDSWEMLSTFYAYPPEIRRIIYTTKIIKGLNRQLRKIIKNKPSFTTDDSVKKMLYLACKKNVEHWIECCRNGDHVVRYIEILFGDRIAGRTGLNLWFPDESGGIHGCAVQTTALVWDMDTADSPP